MQLHAQYDYLQDANQQLRHIFGQITYPNSNIEFLYERSAKLSDADLYQSFNPDTIHQMQWFQVYKEMYYAAHDTATQETFNNVMHGVNNYAADTITMGIMDWDFYKVKKPAIKTPNYFTFDIPNNYFLDHPNPIASPYLVGNVFMASPLLHEACFLDVMFNINPDYLFRDNNTIQYYSGDYQLQIDFGDGNGFININSTTTNYLNINYPTNGEKVIVTRIFNTLTLEVFKRSVSRLNIQNNCKAPQPNQFLTNIPGMTVGVYSSCGSADVPNKKIILVEGFDIMDEVPSQNSGIAELYHDHIELEKLNHLQNYGYDYYVVDWKASKIDMRFNSLHLLMLIEHLKANSPDNQEFVIIGVSMGGVISRYTLNFMESLAYQNFNFSSFFVEANDPENVQYLLQHPNLPIQWINFVDDQLLERTHNTRLLITVDSPHQGANIPLAYQYLFRTLSNTIAPLMPGIALIGTQVPEVSIAQVLDRKATRQLLKWYNPLLSPPIVGIYPPAPSHTSFYAQLKSFGNGGTPQFAKTVALSDGAMNGARQQDPQTNSFRNYNDNIINFKFKSRVKIIFKSFPFIAARARLKTNPNGFGLLANAAFGFNGYQIKLKLFNIKITKQFIPLLPVAISYAAFAQPTCVTAGGHQDLFQINNSVYNDNWSGFGGYLGYDVNMQISSNGAGFCFVPLESALDYDGDDPFNNNILAANINDKLSRTTFDVMAGQVILGKNTLQNNITWRNHGHVANRNNTDRIFNLTQIDAVNSNGTDPEKHSFHTCANATPNDFKALRTFLTLEIGDEELYLENFVTNRVASYRTEFDVKVNKRNPYYEYSSQSNNSNNPLVLDGIYSKEQPFNIVGNGFATFYYDSSSPSPNPGVTISSLASSSFTTEDEPFFICCNTAAFRIADTTRTITPTTQQALLVYPNPALNNTHLHIAASINATENHTQLSVYGINGKLVYNTTVNVMDGKINTVLNLNTLALNKGIYFIKIHNNKTVLNTKFIIN